MHKGLIRKTMKNEDVEVELSFMQQMQKIESDKVLSCTSYFSIYFLFSHICRSADLLIIMLYANVHILDINISEKCQKRKDTIIIINVT